MLRRINESTRQLLRRLMENHMGPFGGNGTPLRTALVRHNVQTTYMVPGDWPRRDGAKVWFEDQEPEAGSDIQYLIDGRVTYDAMLDAMETADQPGHFVILLGWWLQHEFKFSGGKTFLQVARERGELGAAVRVLLYDSPFVDDAVKIPEMEAFNKLRVDQKLDVHAQLDDRTSDPFEQHSGIAAGIAAVLNSPLVFPWSIPVARYVDRELNARSPAAKTGNPLAYGSHHHKIVLVFGRHGLVGFCGGLDINEDRMGFYHDVHLRATGSAARELLTIAEQRWDHAKDNGRPPTTKITDLIAPARAPTGSMPAPYQARVVQTVGNPDLRSSVPNTLWPAIKHAIRKAQRFIYIEDQYLISYDLLDELIDAAERVKHITIVVPVATHEGEVCNLRLKAIKYLKTKGGPGIQDKIRIFELSKAREARVHAKMFVFDDEYAIVGSANANNRGYFTDSEADIGVAEYDWTRTEGARGGMWWSIEANFARRMRIELWAEHLGLESEELFDGVGAGVHWASLPLHAQVAPYRVLNVWKYFATPHVHVVETRPWWEDIPEDWASDFSPSDLAVDPKD
jgi:phosphatidylserine/phosphatidylglycerophosphate/cardiolipin synthase-like enzyme